jgi:hypothetical protein
MQGWTFVSKMLLGYMVLVLRHQPFKVIIIDSKKENKRLSRTSRN